ncbi:PAS domain-containing sensor histidine kinase [Actimicrobium antarcticum]|uniref:Histidine kinase n=1 Tax=Actimicrobium antarcticum TaxID=1051899 RepID=A0ABP7T3R5_9BURK
MFDALQLPLAEAIIKDTSDGIVICDMRLPDAPIVFCNPAFTRMTGYSSQEVIGKNCRFLQKDDPNPGDKAAIRLAISKREPMRTLIRNYRRDGSMFWNELALYPLSDTSGGEHFYAATQRDVTESVQNAEKLANIRNDLEDRVRERTTELREANDLLRREIAERRRTEEALIDARATLTISQSLARLGSWSYDIASQNMTWSDEIFLALGLVPQAIEPRREAILQRTHPDDREKAASILSHSLRTGTDYNREYRVVRSNGEIRHIQTSGKIIFSSSNQPVRLVGSWLDITEHREIEQALRNTQESLRKLGAHQEHVKENERKRIAREIHDELGTLLTGIKAYQSVAVDQARRHCTVPLDTLLEANRLADEAIGTVRRVITDLRPSVLDELGIWTAVEWVAERIAQRANLILNLDIEDHLDDNGIDAERSIALFRIVQEALTNVQKHAKATSVDVQVRLVANVLRIVIKDNGIGIAPEHVDQQESWGLIGMRERIGHFGGELHIHGGSGYGTVVSIHMPLQEITDAT